MANAVIYLLMVTVFTGSWVIDVGAFDPNNLGARWWTFVSYMFLHGGLMHLLMNLLLLFVFGPAVEKRMGGNVFAAYYFTCGIGGAVFSLVIDVFNPLGPMIGASAAVLGIALAFAMFWPNEPIHVFPLPMPIKVKWLVAFFVVMDLLAARSGAQDGVAHFAHLGGFLFGYIFLKSQENMTSRAPAVPARERQALERVRRRLKEPVGAAQQSKGKEKPEGFDRYDEVDRVLDKISESGLESLTPDERRLLDEASRQLRKH
ncbi:MAG: rhomboid family intramembrane serine protease [Gemmatimonadota bacterium]|nr:MAG: rhomboid family intramembrane serine protease [Gemmatimonadota bacterium]